MMMGRNYIEQHLALSKTNSSYQHVNEKLRLFLQKLQDKSRVWYVNAYLEYVMSWILYGVIAFQADVGL